MAVFGDYDVDGATSSALLRRFFRAAGLGSDRLHPGSHRGRLRPQRARTAAPEGGRHQPGRDGGLRRHLLGLAAAPRPAWKSS